MGGIMIDGSTLFKVRDVADEPSWKFEIVEGEEG